MGDGRDPVHPVVRLPAVRQRHQRPRGALRRHPGRHVRFRTAVLGRRQRSLQRPNHPHAPRRRRAALLGRRGPPTSLAHGTFSKSIHLFLFTAILWFSSIAKSLG